MEKNSSINKGLAFVPSTNTNTSKRYNECKLVEITPEIYGFNSVKQMVHLNKEVAVKVEKSIDGIERRLNEVDTGEETVEIFK